MNLLHHPKFWNKKSILAYLLLPLGWIFLLLGKLRNLIYTKHYLSAKVISIGNATIGGTGKTQIVKWLSKKLYEDKIKYLIISKGYGGSYKVPTIVTTDLSAKIVGDEAIELSSYGTTIVARRVIEAIDLIKSLKPEVIIIDDGMQNPTYHKDFILMAIDGMRQFGNGFPLPAGPMRQMKDFSNNDANVIVSVDKDSNIKIDDLDPSITFNANIVPIKNIKYEGEYFPFTGIGNPEKFFLSLKNEGLKYSETKIFPDHYQYQQRDIMPLLVWAKMKKYTPITTRKDYVKISQYIEPNEVICFDVQLEISDEHKLLDRIYEKILPQHKA
jgi:tetraacyldisaccharide 4'-kinase